MAEGLVYLNHAAVSPLPLDCVALMQQYLEELSRRGALHYPGQPLGMLQRLRTLGARLLGTAPDRIFAVRSTTQGLGIAATGLPVKEGDNVVLVEQEFPANIRPWLPLRRRGVEVRMVPQVQGRVLLEDLALAVDQRTAALSISFVQFLSGFRLDPAPVAELCRRHDALFVVDGIQGAGVFPLAVESAGIDFLSADSHKWLLGPEGVGIGYASPRAVNRIQPVLEGWLSVERPFDFFDLDQPMKHTAARYEEGALNMAGIHGLVGSLELILSFGVEELGQRVLALTDKLAEDLGRQGWRILSPRDHQGEKSGILLAAHEAVEDYEALCGELRQRGIVVSSRGQALRISPHGYNTEAELERVAGELKDLVKN